MENRTGLEHLGISRSPEGILQIEIDKERRPVAKPVDRPVEVPTARQPLNNKPNSEADAYRVQRLRDEGKNNVADLLDQSDITEDMQTWIDRHPNFPGLKNYDLRKAFDEGVISNEPGNEDGGMDFLPEEYYKSSRTLSYFNYDQASDTYQYTNAPGRVAAYAVKGFGQSLAETLFVDPIAEPLTLMEAQAEHGDGETVSEIVGYDRFGAEIWMDVPVNAVKVSAADIEETSQALRLYTMPESLANLDLDDSDDIAGLTEGMVGMFAEMGLDIVASRGVTGGPVFKRQKAVNWYRKAMARFKEVGDPTTILGEFLFAKSPNEKNKGTMSSMLAETLEEEFGMEGELIDLMKSLDDSPLSQALAITVEGMFLMEFLRGMALGGYKFTGMKAAVRHVADEMAKAEKILDALNMSMVGFHGSPHKFDKFKMSQMGTGEGAQAYGHGLYFAEDPKVAGQYQRQLSPSFLPKDKRYSIDDQYIDPSDKQRYMAAQELSRADAITAKAELKKWGHDEAAAMIDDIKGRVTDHSAGNFYEVDIPDEQIDRMLDWDKSLSEQPEVAKALRQVASDIGHPGLLSSDKMTAGAAYKGLTGGVGNSDMAMDSKAISDALNELGIPGIKYLDGTSRSAGEGTRNFVVFDENNLKILSRNGEKIPKTSVPKGERIVIPASEIDIPAPKVQLTKAGKPKKGVADPRVNNRLVSAINLPRPIQEIEQGITRISKGQAVPERIITPESIKGQNIMFVYGDKTLGDALITRVDNKALRTPVDAEGGRIFMRTGTNEGYIWSSAKGIISRHMNAAQRAVDANGQPVNVIYVAMSRSGMDFSHMPSDVHLQRVLEASLPSNTVTKYDEIMSNRIEGWVGIKSPDIADFLNANPDRRKLFLEWSDKAGVANLDGMPDVGSSRLAVTDPRLLTTPLDHGGLGISRIDFTKAPRDTSHKTYKTDMPGEYVGDLMNSVPFEILFPNSYAYFRGAYPTTRIDYMAGKMSLTEVADDAWVNRVSEYLEKVKK